MKQIQKKYEGDGKRRKISAISEKELFLPTEFSDLNKASY